MKDETKNGFFFSPFILYPLSFILLIISGCVHKKSSPRAISPAERYRVAVISAGVARSISDKAIMDIGGLTEIELVSGNLLDTQLIRANASRRTLIEARSFDELDKIKFLDFALILLPVSSSERSVGLRSINWRAKTIRVNPATNVPEQPDEWLLEARNGWVKFTSEPTGANIIVGGKDLGKTPLIAMINSVIFKATFKWTPKVSRTVTVNIDESPWAYARAPEKYISKQTKGLYARAQASDEKYGDKIFIVFYALVLVGGMVLLFYKPF